mgnify:CR=1 FL=1
MFRTKSDVCIWETFRLEKLKNSCYLIVTKRRYLNSKSSGGLPKANGNNVDAETEANNILQIQMQYRLLTQLATFEFDQVNTAMKK